VSRESADPAQRNQRGSALQSEGRLDEAALSYREALALDPSLAAAHYNLGTVLQTQGKLDEAIECYRRTLTLTPDHAGAHGNLGAALHDRGLLPEAVASYRRALSLRPQSARLHYNLGNALRQEGRLDDAIASYLQAIALRPAFAAAHNNLGTALQEQGRLEPALESFRRALSLEPNAVPLHHNLASALRSLGEKLQTQGKMDASVACFREAIAVKPDFADAHNDLGTVLVQLGRPLEALEAFQRALALRDAPEFRAAFMHCIRNLEFARVDPALRALITRAVAEAWGKPGDLAGISARLIALDPELKAARERALAAWPKRLRLPELLGGRGVEVLTADPLVRALLESCPVCDLVLERLLTTVRRGLLEAATQSGAQGSPAVLAFACALARQCFINEYVFSCAEEELGIAASLRDRVDAELASGAGIEPSLIAAVASYLPLFSLAQAALLRGRSWPAPIRSLIVQQLDEPETERSLRTTIPMLTPIAEGVSRLVRQQYEENPYPRWTGLAQYGAPVSVDAYLRRHFPYAVFRPLDERTGVDILIAGCGTGREPIDIARQFEGARVMAVDLSLSSLSYAKRKAQELGVPNVEYAQADIMNIGSLGRSFDVISSVGVLHHLADPAAGWRQLLKLLRPGGLMLIGLYSEYARQDVTRVVAARRFIAERGYGQTASDIRRCREDLMAVDGGRAFAPLATFADFFTVSECRDLIFHVQEHRFTLPQIKQLLAELGLVLVAFSLEPEVIDAYRRRFPGDATPTDLDHWHEFETGSGAGPFLGMYIFWVQKKPG
jgi:tetratricopeptide (TPR) repeat protein/2-polyprenyl-3-methyl-5-hydroxy-6-metoxy-1,4-benzoquinol methylase